MPLTVAEQLARGLIPKARSTLFARGSIYEQFAYAPLFWRPQMATAPRRLKRIEVYCPEYETTATIRINDAHSSGTDHLEVDYRSPDHSYFTIAIPDDWTDQDLLDLIFLLPREGQSFAIAPRGEATCHSSSVSFTSFRATQG
jgi:hypothetical protein